MGVVVVLLSEKLASISVSVTSGAFGGGAVIDMLAPRSNLGETDLFSDSSDDEDEDDDDDEDDEDRRRSTTTGDGVRFRTTTGEGDRFRKTTGEGDRLRTTGDGDRRRTTSMGEPRPSGQTQSPFTRTSTSVVTVTIDTRASKTMSEAMLISGASKQISSLAILKKFTFWIYLF